MNIEDFRTYCLAKKGVTEDLPFGPDTLVFKVLGKIFTLTDINDFESINLKCDPEYALELREKYDGVKPGYHMNKTHWNTVKIDSDISIDMIYKLIDHSYDMVISKLSKKEKEALTSL